MNPLDKHSYRITRNRAQCMQCFDIIESKHRHHFVNCKCGAIFIDGGTSYVRSGGSLDNINYLTEYGPVPPQQERLSAKIIMQDTEPLAA